MARKLEAQFEGRYLMSSVLMTSTMKSDPGTPPIRGNSFGVPVSAAATCIVGGSADGRGAGAALGDVDGVAPFAIGGVTVVAAPATATPARNLRRLTSGRGSLRFMEFSLDLSCPAASMGNQRGHGRPTASLIAGYYRRPRPLGRRSRDRSHGSDLA